MTAAPAKAKVWNGAKALRRALVPIGDLEAFPQNPRRGDIPAVAASLRRFGQVRAIVVDGNRIIAGHHVVAAAAELGWTHVAAIPNEFGSEVEARAFLLADNRTAELGTFDTADLAYHLDELAKADALEGTGYAPADLDGFLADLERLLEPAPASDPIGEPLGRVTSTDLREVVLTLNEEQHAQFSTWVNVLRKEHGYEAVTEVVYEAVRAAALAANQG